MSEKASTIYRRSGAGLGTALLLAALVAAYANHFHNSFHFDDAHAIENNTAIRELGNIPRFFADATTFSALPSNQSYRPLVSTMLATDYWLGGGLHPFWFHLSIFAFFIVLVLLVAFVIDRLLQTAASSSSNGWIALAVAAWYGLHPANADTVNYIIASSEVLSTLGIIVSFAVYFGFPQLRRYYIYTVPAAVAVLAKPTAAIFPVLFAIYRLLFPPCSHGPVGRRRLTQAWLQPLAEVIPPFLICGAALFFVQRMTPAAWVAGARDSRNYLMTQPYVALLYFKTFFWPDNLSADYDLNAFTTVHDMRFWAGFIFAVLLTGVSVFAFVVRRTKLVGFGLLWFIIGLLPTSLFPLAEVMNDHRTFLPYIGLVIAVAGGLSIVAESEFAKRGRFKAAISIFLLLVLSIDGYATFQRNKVWKTEETLWKDVATKSPGNPRGLMNYGNTLMAKGEFDEALHYFHQAQTIAPNYSMLLINIAIAEDATNQADMAEEHFRKAAQLAPGSPDSYTYRARHLLSHGRKDEALALLHQALKLSANDATALEFLRDAESDVSSAPAAGSPESYLALSLRCYNEGRYAESMSAARDALKQRPAYAEAWNNICAAHNKLGEYDDAVTACERALQYKPDFDLARNNLAFAQQQISARQHNP